MNQTVVRVADRGKPGGLGCRWAVKPACPDDVPIRLVQDLGVLGIRLNAVHDEGIRRISLPGWLGRPQLTYWDRLESIPAIGRPIAWVEGQREHVVIVGDVNLNGDPNLFGVAEGLRLFGRAFRLSKNGEKDRRQNGDDRDDDQQLDERKGVRP